MAFVGLRGELGNLKEQLENLDKIFKIFGDISEKTASGAASLVAQWLRICLPMQGTQVRALVWEDTTCRGATKPVSHNY